MDWRELRPGVHACLRPEAGANLGLVGGADGWLLVDTAFCAMELLGALDAQGICLSDIALTFNTHFHADHTWGNQLVHSRILGQRRCRELMQEMLDGPWSAEARERWLAELAANDPAEAARHCEALADLRVTPPTETFVQRKRLDLGGRRLEFIHMGGHTPDLSVLWLPDEGVLFASDLLFMGRYPFLTHADVPVWIRALRRLRRFEPEIVVPGHGILAGAGALDAQCSYLEETWGRCAEQRARGRNLEAMLADPGFPRLAGDPTGRRHAENITRMCILQEAPAAAAAPLARRAGL
jgi:cyclase